MLLGAKMKIQGAHVVVTGASQGIGAALTREFCRRAAKVTMVARNKEALESLAGETGAVSHPADLSQPAAVEELARNIERDNGAVDILINNAALGGVGEFTGMTTGTLADHVNTNLLAPMLLTHSFLPGMLERRRGTVVMVSSVAGELAMRNATPYAATKAGLSMFAHDLQRELKTAPVTVMLTVLGEVDTPMLVPVRADPVMATANKRLGKLRTMTPEEVARGMADAIERNRRLLVMPPALRPVVGMRNAPSRLMDLAMLGAG